MPTIEFSAQTGKTFVAQQYDGITNSVVGSLILSPDISEVVPTRYRITTPATGIVYVVATSTNLVVTGYANLLTPGPNGFSELLDTYDEAYALGTAPTPIPIDPDPTGWSTNYAKLLERVGHYLFGIRTGLSVDQAADINDCVNDGLHRVYAAHNWSFLRPVADVVTTAPYATGTITIAAGVVTLSGGTFPAWSASGVLKVNNRYYSVASRNSNTQITLDSTSVTIAAASSYQLARPEIPLDAAFDSVANDSDLTYYPSPDYWYPPVKWRHDASIRQLEGNNPEFDRPMFYSVRTVTFDPTVGSRKVLALYPAPDKVYTLRVPMILRPVSLDGTNLYPIGGEMLTQVILEACLASAEHNFEEREAVHEKRFMQLIELAILDDEDRSSPTSLGPDIGDNRRRFGVSDYAYRLREQRIGGLTLGGTNL